MNGSSNDAGTRTPVFALDIRQDGARFESRNTHLSFDCFVQASARCAAQLGFTGWALACSDKPTQDYTSKGIVATDLIGSCHDLQVLRDPPRHPAHPSGPAGSCAERYRLDSEDTNHDEDFDDPESSLRTCQELLAIRDPSIRCSNFALLLAGAPTMKLVHPVMRLWTSWSRVATR